MSDFKNILEFFRLNRRAEDANKKEVINTNIELLSIENETKYIIDKNIFESDFKTYKRIFHFLEDSTNKKIYVWENLDERKYFVKISLNQYRNLLDETIDILPSGNIKEIPLEFEAETYIYDTGKNLIATTTKLIDEVKLFADTILYDPNAELLKDFDQEKNLDYQYRSHKTWVYDFLQHLIPNNDPEGEPFTKKKSDKTVKVTQTRVADNTHLFPYLKEGQGKYYTCYKKLVKGEKERKTIPFYFKNKNYDTGDTYVLEIEFNSLGAFVSYLNETIFSQTKYFKTPQRQNFLNQYYEMIVEPLIRNLQSSSSFSYEEALKTLFYLPESLFYLLPEDLLWILFEKAIANDSLTNKPYSKEEDVFIKIVKVLASKENNAIRFIERLNKTVSAKDKTSLLEYLYERIHGDNFQEFVSIINQAWRNTRFVDPSPETNPEYQSTDGPMFLPYHSEKWLGFYFSNISITFENSSKTERLLKTLYETGKPQKVTKVSPKAGTYQVEEEIVDQFWYHPFYPIYLKDIENQDTDMKLDAIVPAFTLFANQKKQFWSNVITAGEYAADVVTTLSGVGNLAKYRYLARITQLAEAVEGASAVTKVARAANILRYVKGAAGVLEITSGSVNLMLKFTGARDTEFGESLSKVLFYLELITLAGELTASMKLGLKKSAKEAVEASDGALRVKHPELFAELYKIIGFDNLGRKLVYIVNSEEIGSQANKVVFKIVDYTGNEIGELIRGVGTKGRSTTYKLKFSSGKRSLDLNSEVKLYNSKMARSENLPVEAGQEIIYGDINIPVEITQQYSGLGEIILDDSLAYFTNSTKFDKVDGNFGYWVQFEEYYKDYGGQSINLKKFWEAVDSGKSYEEAVFETFTGQWAKKNGFTKVSFSPFHPIDDKIVVVKFLNN